eukprot:TRINITY_DN57553_c0_g1_i1.p1 TRINITY_DN57553_c0_g1~~TRINITY_DN57553_c0_g1_i1.p1  ORF type:complete len:959 (-),score=102.88 TRINITY_DN57553_c0_g1_i1:82-2958(-)
MALAAITRCFPFVLWMQRCWAYHPDMMSHNSHCIDWIPASELNATHVSSLLDANCSKLNSRTCLAEGTGVKILEVHPLIGICRSYEKSEYPRLSSHDSTTLKEQCRGEIAVRSPACRVWFHHQAPNALPLPLMTAWAMQVDHGRFSICTTRDGSMRVGVVPASGPSFARCVIPADSHGTELVLEGDFGLLGAYDTKSPYAFEVPNSRPMHVLMSELTSLASALLKPRDEKVIAEIVGDEQWFKHLQAVLEISGSSLLERIFSEERFVQNKEANRLGLHLLRCILAERAIDAARELRGYTKHPDYIEFMRDGGLVKNYTDLDNSKLRELMAMVSGYSLSSLPSSVSWELRTTSHIDNDPNLELHVDTFHPSQKMWLAAADINNEHGPFTFVKGSNRNTRTKLIWLYNQSNDPPLTGAGSYGSFRVPDNNAIGVGFSTPAPVRMKAFQLFIGDTSTVHQRGVASEGSVRRTMVPSAPELMGGLPRRNPFVVYREALAEHEVKAKPKQCPSMAANSWFVGPTKCIYPYGKDTSQFQVMPAGPMGTEVPFACFAEGYKLTCMFSLALSDVPRRVIGDYASRDVARKRCQAVHESADLAVLNSKERNAAAAAFVSALREPHFMLANNPNGSDVVWLDGSKQADDFIPPWDEMSGQPNDCLGPGSQTCVFIGPRGRWYDFSCAAEDPTKINCHGRGATSGATLTWEDGSAGEYNLHPLCQVSFVGLQGTGEVQFGWLVNNKPDVQSSPAGPKISVPTQTLVQAAESEQKLAILHTLPHECVAEPSEGSGTDHYCVLSLASETDYDLGEFDSRDGARARCRALSPAADLAVPKNPSRNRVLGKVVSTVGLPHWIGGEDSPNGNVTWLDGSQVNEDWEAPWHEPSGQPNDCDGPGSETCMFMGPHAKWFDFACQPKVPIAGSAKVPTPGPEVTWEDDVRRMYNLYPACGLLLKSGMAVQLGLRIDM